MALRVHENDQTVFDADREQLIAGIPELQKTFNNDRQNTPSLSSV